MARVVLILGVWVAVLSFLGFPIFIKNILFLVTGLALIYLSLLIYKNTKAGQKNIKEIFENFSENIPKLD